MLLRQFVLNLISYFITQRLLITQQKNISLSHIHIESKKVKHDRPNIAILSN